MIATPIAWSVARAWVVKYMCTVALCSVGLSVCPLSLSLSLSLPLSLPLSLSLSLSGARLGFEVFSRPVVAENDQMIC